MAIFINETTKIIVQGFTGKIAAFSYEAADQMIGHAGAIISSAGESAAEKVAMLRDLGVTISPTPSAMGETVAKVLAGFVIVSRIKKGGFGYSCANADSIKNFCFTL